VNIDFLRNFIHLTKYQSFSGLARDISISQSTLSHQMTQLENELGVKLIDRTTRKFKLTYEGKILLGYAEKIIELYDSCRQELSQFTEKLIEDITITASTLPGSHILPKFIANFREKYSSVNFKVSINNSNKSIELLKREMAEFAGIGSFMHFNKNDFDFIEIGEDQLKFICSPNHKLIKNLNKSIDFDELIKYPFIARETGSGTRNIFEQQFKRFEDLTIELEINDNDSIISAVSDSNYISVMSEHIAKKAADAGLIKVLNIKQYPIIAKREIYFIKLKQKELSGLKKKFWEYLKK
jgi:DNA-binding transcriptional LysR family regulator